MVIAKYLEVSCFMLEGKGIKDSIEIDDKHFFNRDKTSKFGRKFSNIKFIKIFTL